MGLRLHELHPSLVHAPLTLLPAAALVDGLALARGDRHLARFGAGLWTGTAISAALAGTAGLAASQEVRAHEKHSQDMMLLHGLANTVVLTAAAVTALVRAGRPPSLATVATGALATGLAVYSGYLGGEMVYSHGLGIKSMPRQSREGGMSDSPPVLSRRSAGRIARDAAKGTRWLVSETGRVLRGRRRLDREALAGG